jgi:HK97 gp10 family phage protein
MVDTFDIRGVDALLAKFEGLKYETRYKGGRFALRKAAQVVRNAAKSNAMRLNDPATGRSIAQNVAERWNSRLYKNTGDLGFRVGVLQGAVLPGKGESSETGAGAPTPHWRLLEFGTEKMAARPFLMPAVQSNIEKATSVFVSEYIKAIDRALKRDAKGK